MGSIGQSIFGGSRSKSEQESGNKAYGDISSALSPQMSQGTQALGSLGALLGVGGDTAGQKQAFQNVRDSTGYDFIQQQGGEAITNSAAAKGLLGSGGTLKGISNFGQQTANTFLMDYIKNLLGVNQAGTQAAGVISDAGKYSKGSSSSSEKPGIAKFLGQLAGGAAGG